jgi:hypothetical protein
MLCSTGLGFRSRCPGKTYLMSSVSRITGYWLSFCRLYSDSSQQRSVRTQDPVVYSSYKISPKESSVSRTHGVSIFADQLPSRCDTEKGGGKGKGHWIDNRTRLTAVQPEATWSLPPAQGEERLLSPPPTPEDYGQILATSPKVKDGLHFGD